MIISLKGRAAFLTKLPFLVFYFFVKTVRIFCSRTVEAERVLKLEAGYRQASSVTASGKPDSLLSETSPSCSIDSENRLNMENGELVKTAVSQAYILELRAKL